MPAERHVFLGMAAIVASPAMARVLEIAQRVARSHVAVLVSGETGSGKEIVSRAIHHHSLRCSKPWVDINCGALPDQLMESELFGHEKGAFSGADSTKPGMFELAHTGTLFLDEVAELDPRMQVKLLRVLDNVPYYRLGGQKKVQVDVRVIAATNQDLEQAVAAGRFRSDLYHRLAEYEIHVPPLRERVEDIVPLAEYFLAQHSEQAVFADAAVAPCAAMPGRATSANCAMPWSTPSSRPGNIWWAWRTCRPACAPIVPRWPRRNGCSCSTGSSATPSSPRWRAPKDTTRKPPICSAFPAARSAASSAPIAAKCGRKRPRGSFPPYSREKSGAKTAAVRQWPLNAAPGW